MRIYKKLKLAIVGYGFVGKATDQGFNKRVTKYIVDPLLGTSIAELKDFEPEIVFICVPTPMKDDGSQDASIISSVTQDLSKYCPKAIKVVKSTVIPSILEELKLMDKNLIYNPEFLREKHANFDFVKSYFFKSLKLICVIKIKILCNCLCVYKVIIIITTTRYISFESEIYFCE